MNKLSIAKRAKVVRLLVEGSSLRTISRAEDLSINTVTSILVAVGKACLQFHNDTVVNIPAKIVQADEIWSFVYAKEKNKEYCKYGGVDGMGNAWTWVGMDADTKLVIGWLVGDREADTANEFMRDMASRLKHRVQLTTDGHKPYLKAVEDAFEDEIDYSMLIKIYGKAEGTDENERRYSPATCTGSKKVWVSGDPNPALISTSYVERQNLTMRMSMRRFTRLTNAFSKKLENHICAIALHYAYYNFCRIHKTLRVTPAMEAKIATRPMTIEDLVRIGYADEIAKEEKRLARRLRYSVTH